MADDNTEEEMRTFTLNELKERYFDQALCKLVADYMGESQKPNITLFVTIGALMGTTIGASVKTLEDAQKLHGLIGMMIQSAAQHAFEHRMQNHESKLSH